MFRKILRARFGELEVDAPILSGHNCTAVYEIRSKLDWALLSCDLDTGPRSANDTGVPIVVVTYRCAEFVLDGNKRCRLWHATGDPGKREAIIIRVEG